MSLLQTLFCIDDDHLLFSFLPLSPFRLTIDIMVYITGHREPPSYPCYCSILQHRSIPHSLVCVLDSSEESKSFLPRSLCSWSLYLGFSVNCVSQAAPFCLSGPQITFHQEKKKVLFCMKQSFVLDLVLPVFFFFLRTKSQFRLSASIYILNLLLLILTHKSESMTLSRVHRN